MGISQKPIKELILDQLSLGPMKVPNLVKLISVENNYTEQGVYKILRAMRKEEFVTVHKKTASLSIIWLQSEIDRLAAIKTRYSLTSYIQELKNKDRKSIKFNFNSFHEFDLFWTHAFLIVEDSISYTTPAYMLIPHDLFFYSRITTDRAWMNKLSEHKRISRAVITHTTALDKKISAKRKELMGEQIQYLFNKNPLKQKENFYYNIIGPWIFLGTLDKEVSQKISTFTRTHTGVLLSKKDEEELASMTTSRGKFTLTIYHSEKKSISLLNRVHKYFE